MSGPPYLELDAFFEYSDVIYFFKFDLFYLEFCGCLAEGAGRGGPLQGRTMVLHAFHIPAPDIFTENAATAQIRVRNSDRISRRFF
jgi:hypothetical protein